MLGIGRAVHFVNRLKPRLLLKSTHGLFCVLLLELSDEAEMMVRKALGSGPNDVLSDAFRIRISRNDMATLGGLNWLNDEVTT